MQQLEGAASRGGEQIDDGLDRFVGMVIGRFEPAVGSLGLGLMTTKPEPSWGRASLQASQHDINSKCCNLVGAFELSQCADCERPALSSVPPTVKAVAAKQSAAFLKSARSDQAPVP